MPGVFSADVDAIQGFAIEMQHPLSKSCIYCGRVPKGVAKGEHVVQDAIGGALTISQLCPGRTVCRKCNNGPLSEIDLEFCSRSPISIVAARTLDAFIWQSWEVDHSSRNLLLEAEPDFSSGTMKVLPQLVFDDDALAIYAAESELKTHGCDYVQGVFMRYLIPAFKAYRAGNVNRLNPKRINRFPPGSLSYRYPPRVFARRALSDFKKGMSFEFQYVNTRGREHAIASLSTWSPSTRFGDYVLKSGSELPLFGLGFDIDKVLRCIVKNAINLLAAYCHNTPVSNDSMPLLTRYVLGQATKKSADVKGGFTYNSDIQAIAATEHRHAFRINYDNGRWNVFGAYFGGSIGTFACFPGPNKENWRSARIVVPLRDKKWPDPDFSRLLLPPLRARIEWLELGRIMPEIPFLNCASEIVGVPIMKRG